MAQPLHSSGTLPLPMVYLCECGTKWNSAPKPAWDCKCGRPLVKRNGIIHAEIVQTSGEMATVGNRYPPVRVIPVPLQKTI